MSELVVLNKVEHKNANITAPSNGTGSWLFAKNDSLCPIVLLELRKLIKHYTLVFINSDIKAFSIYALLSFTKDNNKFVTETGEWKVDYIPSHYRKYPFVLANQPGSEAKVLCVEKNNTILSLTETSNGRPLFNENSEPTEHLSKILEFMKSIEENKITTQKAVDLIQEFELLEELNIKIKMTESEQKIKGLWKIDEKKFMSLDEKALLKLRESRALDLIYGHLFSLDNLSTLATLSGDSGIGATNASEIESNKSLKERAIQKQEVEDKKELDNLVKNLLIDD